MYLGLGSVMGGLEQATDININAEVGFLCTSDFVRYDYNALCHSCREIRKEKYRGANVITRLR